MKRFFSILIASLGGFQFGYNTSVISGALLFLAKDFSLTAWEEGIAASIILLGALLGASLGGSLANRLGRIGAQKGAALFFIVGAVSIFFSKNLDTFLLGRFIQGFGVGVVSMVAPMYLAEIAPSRRRGFYVSTNQLAVTIGIFIAYLVNLIFAKQEDWRFIFGVGVVPAIVYLVGLFFIPESLSHQQEELIHKTSWKSLKIWRFRKLLFIGIFLSVFQQITGINIVIYFAPSIFEASGYSTSESAIFATLWLGLMNVIATTFSLWLIDKVGRRPLLIASIIFMVLGLFVIALGLYERIHVIEVLSFASLMIYIAAFAIGMGPIPWLIISEIYPLSIRGHAMSLATFANWLANYFMALTFLDLVHLLSPSGAFFLYGCIGIVALFFILKRVPETKGKSLETLSKELKINLH